MIKLYQVNSSSKTLVHTVYILSLGDDEAEQDCVRVFFRGEMEGGRRGQKGRSLWGVQIHTEGLHKEM